MSKITEKKLSDYIQDPKNFNKGSEYGEALIEKSVGKFGAGRSMLVSDDGVLIAGNKSHQKLAEAGIEKVIEVETDGKTAVVVKRTDIKSGTKKFHELALADNATSKANLNFDEVLVEEILSEETMNEWGIGTSNPMEAKEDDYEIPAQIETDIVLGDLFEIGEHRLLCGDSRYSDQVAKLMNGEKADMLTDPPYGININMNMGRLKGQPKKFEDKDWDKSVPDFFYLIELFDKKIIWGGNYFADRLPVTKDWLCWYKKTKDLDFAEFELAWTNTDANARHFEHHWSGEKKLHPTMKPLPVIAWCIGFLKSNLLFDPFLGSGTTMVAAHQLNRKCYGMELDPKYCQVTVDRMKKLDPSLVVKKNGEAYKAPINASDTETDKSLSNGDSVRIAVKEPVTGA